MCELHQTLFHENDTAKSRGCFMKKLRFVGNTIQTILSSKKQTRADAYLIIEISKKI